MNFGLKEPTVSTETDLVQAASHSQFSAANRSTDQGAIYWMLDDASSGGPTDSMSRLELAKKASWLCSNVPLAGAIVNRMADQVVGDGLRIQPMTEDREWNRLRAQRFHEKAKSKHMFDVSHRRNFYAWQKLVLRRTDIVGDCFSLLAKDPAGFGRLAFYEGYQVGDHMNSFTGAGTQEENLFEGVKIDKRTRRPLWYQFLTGDSESGTRRIKPRDVMHHYHEESSLQNRGLSQLKTAVGHLIDRTEVTKFTKQGIKAASLLGFYSTGGKAGTKTEMASQLMSLVKGANGDTITVKAKEVFGQGGEFRSLGEGEELKTLHDDRPGPNAENFDERLVREIAIGYGIQPEIVWNVAALGGANTRLVLKLLEPWVKARQQWLVDELCTRFYIWDTALELQRGTLPYPKGDVEWWPHGWLTPERLTVDVGRDGNLKLKLCQEGLITLSDWFGGLGQSWENQTDQWAEEKAYRFKALREAEQRHGLETGVLDT